MLTFTQTVNCAKKKKSWVYAQLFWSSCTFFFFAVKCTEISMRVIVHLWEAGVGIIKLQNDSFVLSAFLEIRWPGRVGCCYLLCWRPVCLGFPWPLKWDILALCTWVVTIFSSRRMFEALLSCLWCSIQPSCCVSFGYPLGIFMFNQE